MEFIRPETGRSYSLQERKDIFDKILAEMEQGNSFRQSCKNVRINYVTVFNWMDREIAYPSEDYTKLQLYFRQQYARARDLMYDSMAEETVRLADESLEGTMTVTKGDGTEEKRVGDNVARSKLAVETRKWLLSKLASKRYGDKLSIGGDPDNPIKTVTKIERVIVRPGSSELQNETK